MWWLNSDALLISPKPLRGKPAGVCRQGLIPETLEASEAWQWVSDQRPSLPVCCPLSTSMFFSLFLAI